MTRPYEPTPLGAGSRATAERVNNEFSKIAVAIDEVNQSAAEDRPTVAQLAANTGAALIGSATGITVEARIAAEESAWASGDSARPTSATLAGTGGAALVGTSGGGTVQGDLNLKAPLASPAFTGNPTAPTAAGGTNTTQIASTAFVRSEVAALVGAAPGTLDTLNELAEALGGDPDFAATTAAALGARPTSATLAASGGAALIGAAGGTVQALLTALAIAGLNSAEQLVIGSNTTLSFATHGGRNILVSTAGVTITLPASGFPTGKGVAIKNVATGAITLTYAGGGDGPTTLEAGRSLILLCDGAGFWREYMSNAGAVPSVAGRTAMANMPHPIVGGLVFDTSASGGLFVTKAGTAPGGDSLFGLTKQHSNGTMYFERIWDKVNGKPEWFGAITNDSGFDCLAALNACVALCPVTNLASADYWISATWKIQTQYRMIFGGGYSDGYATGNGTRILCTNAGATVLQVGPDSAPATTPQYYQKIRVSNIMCGHGVNLTGNATRINSTKTIVCQYLLDCEFERVYAWEPLIGFYLFGCIASYFRRCKVFRSAAQLGANDFAYAFWIRGVSPVLNGGNPSTFIIDGAMENGGGLSIEKIGLYIDGAAADLFVDRFETSAATHGIRYAASGSVLYGHQDIHFRACVFDQCASRAVFISGLNANGAITISGGYYQSNVAATSVILLQSGAGAVSICDGAQIVCGTQGNMRGVEIDGQANVTIDESVIISDCSYGVVAINGSSGMRVTCTINNPNIGNATTAAVYLDGATEGFIAPRVLGSANGFGQGVWLVGTGNNKITVDPTRVSAAAISGGAASKVIISATGITAPGYYTSAGAAGASGAGINVIGITA